MFGFLKKKLQAVVAKVAGKIEPNEASEQELKEESKISEEKQPVEYVEPAIERLEEEIEEHIEEVKEIEEAVEKERISEQAEFVKEEKRELEELKREVEEEKPVEKEVEERIIEHTKPEIIEKIKEKVKPERKVEEEILKRPTPEIKIEEKEEKPAPRGLLRRLVEKTLSEGDVESILKELEMALLESDVAVEVSERICADVKGALLGQSVRRGKIEDVIRTSLHDAILDVLDQPKVDVEQMIRDKDGPFLVILVGFNGAGKTTTLAKLANKFREFKPILAAGDTFRAASIEQLEEHGRRLGVEVIKHRYGSDSAAVIFDAMKHAKAVGSKLVLADTAGRSHVNINLMDELKKVIRVNKPDLKILALDALTGNDIYDQARLFDEAVGVDGVILTKSDVYEKGGAALSAAYTLKKPILFLGTGQEYKDLQTFNPHNIAKNLVG